MIINRDNHQALDFVGACRYVGHWGMRNSNMRVSKEFVIQKINAVRDLIKCHPLTRIKYNQERIDHNLNVVYFTELNGLDDI